MSNPESRSVPSPEKRIDRMDRLGDMGHFPVVVHAGASVNILVTVAVTWWLVPRYQQSYAPLVWVALVLVLNLLPVVLLRVLDRNPAAPPTLRTMNFYRDQHRFSDWVYLAASTNMAFWILVSWAVFVIFPTGVALAVVLVVAFVMTFSPVLLRLVRHAA
jgi:hypothetical protein